MSLGEPILYPQSRARTVTTPPGCFNALFCASARASLQFQLRRVFPPVSGLKAPLCLPDSCTALRLRPQSPFQRWTSPASVAFPSRIPSYIQSSDLSAGARQLMSHFLAHRIRSNSNFQNLRPAFSRPSDDVSASHGLLRALPVHCSFACAVSGAGPSKLRGCRRAPLSSHPLNLVPSSAQSSSFSPC